MKTELQQLRRYLHDALSVDVVTKPWRVVERLPRFLRERYEFAQTEILETPCLFVIDLNPVEEPPATVRKHLDLLRIKDGRDIIYVRQQVTAYNRKRLIEQKIPFIVPGNQMYLPMLAIDLREHFRQMCAEPVVFSPATQAVVIHTLLHDAKEELIPLDMARRLGYSAMTMTRAFNELEAAKLATTTARGRERCLRFLGTRRETWEKAQPYLRSPVMKRLFIEHHVPLAGLRAGLTALAEYSMLSPPTHPTLVVSGDQWNEFRQHHKVPQIHEADPDGREVQVWSYPPILFARKDVVDPLSLYLSLKEDHDERTQASLDEMMRKLGW